MRLIDADALIEIFVDRFDTVRNRYGDHSGEAGICAGALHLIMIQPTIEPERKTGHWIYIPEESEKHIEKIYRCSACNNNDAWGATELTKYCSWCGAKMIGVKEDEEADIS